MRAGQEPGAHLTRKPRCERIRSLSSGLARLHEQSNKTHAKCWLRGGLTLHNITVFINSYHLQARQPSHEALRARRTLAVDPSPPATALTATCRYRQPPSPYLNMELMSSPSVLLLDSAPLRSSASGCAPAAASSSPVRPSARNRAMWLVFEELPE